MRKVLAVVVALLAVAGGYGAYVLTHGRPAAIRIATEGAYPPFNFIGKDGQLAGFDVDIARALCARMQRRCKIVAQDWDGIIPGLLSGQYDAIVSSLAITAQRSQQIAFTDPYYDTPTRFVAPKGSRIEISVAGLAGKRVGVQRATVQEKLLRSKFYQAVPVLYDSQDAALKDLVADNIDLALGDAVMLAESFLDTPAGKDFQFVGPSFTDPDILGVGAGIAVRQDETQLLAAFNKALAEIRADGTFKQINDKYFGFDISPPQ
ncbi:MAG TPA: transporter substrate-binding domain-containing protein [Dongiaceae bacterium]|nr:transporter substrate-binding domain-containing protein [Dongiaceae bacterium]